MSAARTWSSRWLLLLILALSGAQAQDGACVDCHDDVVVQSEAHPDLACVDCHTNVPADHEGDDLEPLTDEEACSGCHRRSHREAERSVHGGEAMCRDCHGDSHSIHLNANLDSAVSPVNQLQYCGECHNEPATLVDSYRDSVHGHALLRAGLIDAPSCSDCHGAHDMREVDDRRAPTSHANSPEMCGSCHVLVLDDWKDGSAHGIAWQNGSEDVPVCTSCHDSHDIRDPQTPAVRLASADVCGGCHEEALRTYREGFHGKATNLGMITSATCADCHTPHKNLPADDPLSTVHADNLLETCGSCHEGITASFVSFNPHSDPTNPDDNFIVYVIWLFMVGLLLGVFGFFGVHDSLWLQRSLVGVIRGEFDKESSGNGQYVRRFSRLNIGMHLVIIVTFLLLALTGLPLKFSDTAWAMPLINLLGGLESAGIIHRIAAIGTFGYAFFHLGHLFVRAVIRRERGLFWGPNSMVPQPKDFSDLWANFKYFLYLGEQPEGDRWNYIEKFDYLAVFWGVLMIGLSGLMLWAPITFTQVIPGWLLNAAYVIHSEEALLATGFIFIFHFFHTHLRPGSFPMDIVIFTGKVPLERFREERPLEYQRLVENGELDDYLVEPPTAAERRNAYIIGSVSLAIGLLLAVGIVWALLTH